MPDNLSTFADRLGAPPPPEPEDDQDAATLSRAIALPSGLRWAILRGVKGKCPRCGAEKLFPRFLKPMAACSHCGQDWSHQRADDFPAYISIFITGHVLAPLIIRLARDTDLSSGAMLAIIIPLASVMMVGLLQPAKGAVMAMQWWFGMHGFKPGKAESRQ